MNQNQAQNQEQSPQPEKPISIYPISTKEAIDESTRQARRDIQAILDDAEKNKRPWPKTPENVKAMSLIDLIQRIKELNNMEDQLLWGIEHEDDRKRVVELESKKLDVNRLRRSFGEHVQMREDVKDMILAEDSPVTSKDKPGYVYMGRFKDQELWIKDKQRQLAKVA